MWSTFCLMQACGTVCIQNPPICSSTIEVQFSRSTWPAFQSSRVFQTKAAAPTMRWKKRGLWGMVCILFALGWASALGWDQVHVNTTLPGFIDDAFCGILIGAVVMPRKTWAWKWNAPCWVAAETGWGNEEEERCLSALLHLSILLQHCSIPLNPYSIPLYIFPQYLSSL